MAYNTFSAMAGGSIYPSRFVKLSSAADQTVLQAGTNDEVIGVSSDAAQHAPIPNALTTAAEAGDALKIESIGTIALVEVGTGGVTRGDRLKADGAPTR